MKTHSIDQIHRRQFLTAAAVFGVAPWLLTAKSGEFLPNPRFVGASALWKYFPSGWGVSGILVAARKK